MLPTLILLILMWSVCLLIFCVSIVIYVYVDDIQEAVNAFLKRNIIRTMELRGLRARNQLERLSDEYLKKVLGLYKPSKGVKNDEEE